MLWFFLLALTPILAVPIANSVSGESIYSSDRAKRIYLTICGTVLFLMIALRSCELGSVDSQSYYNNWKLVRDMSLEGIRDFITLSDMESGYLMTVWLLSHVFYDPQFLFVLTGLLFSFSVCRFIYLNSKDAMISMLMYICLGTYIFMVQGLRQAIAMSICLLAVESIKKRRLIRFALAICIAFMYHRTVVVFALLYFLFGTEFSRKTKIAMPAVMAMLLALTPVFVRFGNELIDGEYTDVAGGGALIATAIYAIIIAVAYLFLDNRNTDKNDTFFIWMTLVGASFYLMRYLGTQIMDRISFYFLMGQTIALPCVISKFDRRSRRVINLIVCILCILLFFYRLNSSYGLEYKFFWQ